MIGGDFLTSKDYDLNIWETNTSNVFSVQGEAESRTINFHLKEEVKVENPRGEITTQPKPFDLTGYSARFYVKKTDNTQVFFDGTITDTENGIVSFTLPYQATTVSGEIPGTVLLTKPGNATLKAIGITLDVQENDLDGSIESTDEFSALVVALNKIDEAADKAEQAVSDARQVIDTVNAKLPEMDEATDAANKAAANADEKATLADQKAAEAGAAAQYANSLTAPSVTVGSTTTTEPGTQASVTNIGTTHDLILNFAVPRGHDGLYQMVNPYTGRTETLDVVIDTLYKLFVRLNLSEITAGEYDALDLTAGEYDAKDIAAIDYDTRGKSILIGG